MNRSTGYTTAGPAAELAQIRVLAHRLDGPEDLDALIRLAAAARYVCLGEASHGTSEYYRWRAVISRRLIEEHGYSWIGVEGDWARLLAHQPLGQRARRPGP